MSIPALDVRDAANAVKTLLEKEASDGRILYSNSVFTMDGLIEFMKKEFKE